MDSIILSIKVVPEAFDFHSILKFSYFLRWNNPMLKMVVTTWIKSHSLLPNDVFLMALSLISDFPKKFFKEVITCVKTYSSSVHYLVETIYLYYVGKIDKAQIASADIDPKSYFLVNEPPTTIRIYAESPYHRLIGHRIAKVLGIIFQKIENKCRYCNLYGAWQKIRQEILRRLSGGIVDTLVPIVFPLNIVQSKEYAEQKSLTSKFLHYRYFLRKNTKRI